MKELSIIENIGLKLQTSNSPTDKGLGMLKRAGVNPDPNTPIPDRSPGKNLKAKVHTSEGKVRHIRGERNVSSTEEHSRVAKGNRGVKK